MTGSEQGDKFMNLATIPAVIKILFEYFLCIDTATESVPYLENIEIYLHTEMQFRNVTLSK